MILERPSQDLLQGEQVKKAYLGCWKIDDGRGNFK
jgi:hypothetical protein